MNIKECVSYTPEEIVPDNPKNLIEINADGTPINSNGSHASEVHHWAGFDKTEKGLVVWGTGEEVEKNGRRPAKPFPIETQ